MSDEVTQPDAATEGTEAVDEAQPDAADTDTNAEDDTDESAESFPREYVEKLRRESQGYRDRLKAAERELFTARVAATGRLADPTDLAYIPDTAGDAEALSGAIDALLEAKPHLRARRVSGDVGQGALDGAGKPPTFADLLRGGR